MNPEEGNAALITENLNEKKMRDYMDALIFRSPDHGDETLAQLRAELVAKIRVVMSLYGIAECWECVDGQPCADQTKCLKTLTKKFILFDQ